jgi:hypothetical protein
MPFSRWPTGRRFVSRSDFSEHPLTVFHKPPGLPPSRLSGGTWEENPAGERGTGMRYERAATDVAYQPASSCASARSLLHRLCLPTFGALA